MSVIKIGVPQRNVRFPPSPDIRSLPNTHVRKRLLADIQINNDYRRDLAEWSAKVDAKVWFSPVPLLLGTGFFATCTAWLALGPDTSGPVGRVLISNGGALTIVAVAIGMVATLFFGFHATMVVLRMPALVASDHGVQLYVLPIERLRWSEIADVRMEEGKLLIVTQGGRSRRINLALLTDYEMAVAEMQATLAERGSEQMA